MRWLTADIVFDGYDFHKDYYLQVDDAGIIRQVICEKPGHSTTKCKGLLMPGMINAHCHLELSYTQGRIAQKTGLSKFLQSVNEQLPQKTDESIVQDAIKEADAEMLKNGIVAVGDICNTAMTLTTKMASVIHYHNFVECIAIRSSDVERRFIAYRTVYNELDEECETSYALHAPYTCHEGLYKLVNQHSNFISIHNQESEAENLLFEGGAGDFDNFYRHFGLNKNEIVHKRTKASSFENSQRLLSAESKKLFVHNTFTRKEDLTFADTNSWFCFCPKANLYIENQLPDFQIFSKYQERLVLGTDSLASNDSLSILEEVKTIQDNFPKIPLGQLLQWATSNGARLFGLDSSLGSFEKGKSPGFINIQDFDISNHKLRSAKCQLA